MKIDITLNSLDCQVTINGEIDLYSCFTSQEYIDITWYDKVRGGYMIEMLDLNKIHFWRGYSCRHDFILKLSASLCDKTKEYIRNLFSSKDDIEALVCLIVTAYSLKYQHNLDLGKLVQDYISNPQDRWKFQYWIILKSIVDHISSPSLFKRLGSIKT